MKNVYRSMNEKINPPEALREKVFAKIEQPKRRLNFHPLATVAAVLAVVMLATPVMAAYVPPIAELMYQVSPEMAARFTPIQESDEKNDVRMEIISTSIHGATAEICIGFEDLNGDRLSRQIMINNMQILGKSPFLSGGAGGSMGATDYDEESGKFITVIDRTFHYYSEKEERYMTVQEIFGNKLTVRVDWLYQFVEQPAVEVPSALTENEVMTVEVDNSRPTDRPVEVPFDGFGRGSAITGDPWLQQDHYDLLTPGEPVYEITRELVVTGIAYIDGELHVQTRLRPEKENEGPIYYLCFVDAAGNTVGEVKHNTFTIDKGADRGDYMESIYDIPEDQLEKYTLMCVVSEREVIKGPWRVTFPITESNYVGEHDDGVPESIAPDFAFKGEWME